MSKYTKPIPLDELPETPAVYGEMIEEYNQTKKTVSRDIEVEGLGKGRLVLSKQNKGKPFFYADEANIEANQKAAKQLQTAETIANLPLILAPFFTIAKGGQRIIKQRRDNQIKKSVLGAQDLDKVNNVIDLVKSKTSGTTKPVIPTKTTAPTTSIMNMYKDTGITPQQKRVLSTIVLQAKKNDMSDDEPLDVEAELKAYYEKLDRELAPPKQEDIVISGAKVRTRRIMDRDLKDLLLKYPDIDPDRARRYVDLNARGIADIKKTIEYLNDVSLKNTPNPDDLEDVAAEFSVIFGVDAQVEDLQKIIEERGEIMFKTQSMDQPFVIRDLSDLKAAYFQRLNVLKKANVFDEGHVFAVNSLLRDKNVKDIATYYKNIEPEIARSIEQLIDKQTLEELIAPGQGPAYLEKVVLGNRSRKDENDPDKAVARVFGGAYGVEEDFLNFMFPERTVAERVPPELKDTFVDLYNKELAALLQNFPKSKPGQGGLQIGSYTLERLKEQIQNLVADEMNLATGLNTALNETEYQRIKRENPEILLYLDERFGGKEEYVTPDKPARRIRRKGIDTKGLDEFRVGSSWDIGE